MLKPHFHLYRLEQTVTIEKLKGGKAPLFDEAFLVMAQSMLRRMAKISPRHFKERETSDDDKVYWRNFQNLWEIVLMVVLGLFFLVLAIIWFIDMFNPNTEHGFFYADNFFGAHIWAIAFLLCSLILLIGAFMVYRSRQRQHKYLYVNTGVGPYSLTPFGVCRPSEKKKSVEEAIQKLSKTLTTTQPPSSVAPSSEEQGEGDGGIVPLTTTTQEPSVSIPPVLPPLQPPERPQKEKEKLKELRDPAKLRKQVEVDVEYDYPPEHYIKADKEVKAAFQAQLLRTVNPVTLHKRKPSKPQI